MKQIWLESLWEYFEIRVWIWMNMSRNYFRN